MDCWELSVGTPLLDSRDNSRPTRPVEDKQRGLDESWKRWDEGQEPPTGYTWYGCPKDRGP